MTTNWDKTKPPGNRTLRLSNPDILANWAALEDALAREHNFPGNQGTDAGQHITFTMTDQGSDPAAPETGRVVLYSKAQLPYIRVAGGAVLRAMTGEGGGVTKCFFLQDTAPTGWTIESGCADALLAVKGGANAYNVSGGSKLQGTWTQASHVHDMASHTHTGPSHVHSMAGHVHTIESHSHSISAHSHTTGDVTLTAAQSGLPAHSHTIPGQNTIVQPGIYATCQDGELGNPYNVVTSTAGGSGAEQAHNHGSTYSGGDGLTGSTGGGNTGSAGSGNTGSEGTGNTSGPSAANTGNSATTATYRPLANVGIIASLN